jgi:uncharacterized repeat protein (TIGR03803 family)
MGKINSVAKACSVFFLWAAAAIPLPAQAFTSLHSFANTDGANPTAGLVQGIDGNLYGTTYLGGDHSYGTIFKVSPTGALTPLHNFDATDGSHPPGNLVQDGNGNFYGATQYGGAGSDGTVFNITPTGALTSLHSFDGTDGFLPYGGLVLGANGDFYGTTYYGGVNNEGTIFEIAPGGRFTSLHSFNGADGENPLAGLVRSASGNFYGTTAFGGANNQGTIFEITPGGILTTIYSFCPHLGCADGEEPEAGLIQATDGFFYGTTPSGGANSDGTVFKITTGGVLTTLHSFNGADGKQPYAGLIQGTDGNLYGTTRYGGANSEGTVFQISPSGALNTLYSFCSQGGSNCTDGQNPQAGLLQDTNGNFFGTTYAGGAGGFGTIFTISVGLVPFVEAQPASGQIGLAVKILGTNLTGATSVAFNGIPATFTVVSPSLITATVPAGAVTGPIKVTLPHGTRLSNVPFRVTD